MSFADTTYLLIAQYSRWRRLGDGLRSRGPRTELSDLIPLLIVVAVIGIGLAIGVQIYKRRDFSKNCDDPGKMFRELCQAHQLGIGDRRLLLRMATALEMPQPAALFLSPQAFRTEALPPQCEKDAERVKELARRLF